MKRFIMVLGLSALAGCASQKPAVSPPSPLHATSYTLQYNNYHVTITDFEMRGQSFREVEMDAPRQNPSHIQAIDKQIDGTYEIYRITEDHYTCASPGTESRCPGNVLRRAQSLVEGAVGLNTQERSSEHALYHRPQQ